MLETLIAVLSYSPDLNYPAEVSFASWMKKGCASRTLPTSVGIKKGFTSEELSGATFSISNMGMLGIEHFAAVIVPPQAAILAVSAIKDRPVVRNGQLAVGKTMMMTVSCDHRIVDGVVAGRFLQELKRFLENPPSLLL